MSSVYITQETGGRLTSGVEKFNNSFLPEGGSRWGWGKGGVVSL